MPSRIPLILLILFSACSGDPELVDIPDAAFLEALVRSGVDTDGDGQISRTEAMACTSITLPPSGISDLTGIQEFTNLVSLTTGINPLERMDLAGNPLLNYLDCSNGSLTDLDLSRQSELRTLICIRNQLEELDLSANSRLELLKCNNNLLTELDLSPCAELTGMTSCGNLLRSLDISAHTKLTLIGVDNMPGLDTVWVWTLPFPPEGVRVLMGYSPNIHFLIPE